MRFKANRVNIFRHEMQLVLLYYEGRTEIEGVWKIIA
jgi:hypothetical protein